MELFTWNDSFGVPHIVKCDVVVSFKDARTSEPTKHPVENGKYIADHIIHNPDILSVQLGHSNEPIEPGEGWIARSTLLPVIESRFQPQGLLLIHGAVAGAFSNAITKPIKTHVLSAIAPSDRIQALHDDLIKVKQGGFLCKFTFRGRIYRDQLVTSVTLTYDRTSPPVFDIETSAIATVKTALADLPDPADFHAKPTVSLGPAAKKVPSEAEIQRVDPSLLKWATNGGLDAIAGSIL